MIMLAKNIETAGARKQAGNEPKRDAASFPRPNPTVYVLDKAGRIIDTNELVSPLIGLPLDSLIGRKIAEFMDPAMAFKTRECFRLGGGSYMPSIEGTLRDRSGRLVSVRGEAVPIVEDDGLLAGMVIRFERRLIKLAPKGGADLPGDIEDLLNSLNEPVLEFGPDLELLFQNPAAEKFFGDDAERREAHVSLIEFLDPRDAERVARAAARAIEDGEGFTVPVRLKAAGAELVAARARLRGIEGPGSKRALRMVVLPGNGGDDSAAAGTEASAITDESGNVLHADREFAGLLGFNEPAELRGENIKNVLKKALAEAGETGEVKEAASGRQAARRREGEKGRRLVTVTVIGGVKVFAALAAAGD